MPDARDIADTALELGSFGLLNTGGSTGAQAAEDQLAAAQEAQAQAQADLLSGRTLALGALQGNTQATLDTYNQAFPQTLAQLSQGYQFGMDALGQANQAGLGAVQDYAEQGMGQVAGGYQGAQDALLGGAQGGASALQGGLSAGLGELKAGDRLSGLLDQQGGLYGNYQEDPGYKFRLAQGQKALDQKFAASGGRFGGDAIKAAVDYNQGMASQEFGNYAGRQNQIAGLSGGVDAAGNAMASQRGQAQLGTANTLSGLLANTGAQSAGYAAQGGQALGNMSQSTGNTLAQLVGGYGTNLANMGINQGSALAGATQTQANNLANTYNASGTNQANVLTGAASQLAQTDQAAVPYAGGSNAYLANLGGQVLGAGAGAAGTIIGGRLSAPAPAGG